MHMLRASSFELSFELYAYASSFELYAMQYELLRLILFIRLAGAEILSLASIQALQDSQAFKHCKHIKIVAKLLK